MALFWLISSYEKTALEIYASVVVGIFDTAWKFGYCVYLCPLIFLFRCHANC